MHSSGPLEGKERSLQDEDSALTSILISTHTVQDFCYSQRRGETETRSADYQPHVESSGTW